LVNLQNRLNTETIKRQHNLKFTHRTSIETPRFLILTMVLATHIRRALDTQVWICAKSHDSPGNRKRAPKLNRHVAMSVAAFHEFLICRRVILPYFLAMLLMNSGSTSMQNEMYPRRYLINSSSRTFSLYL